MKKKIVCALTVVMAIMALTLVSALPLTGCKTVPGGTTTTFDVDKAAVDLQLVSNVGVYYLLKNNPNQRQVIQAVADGIDLLIDSSNTDANALAETVAKAIGGNATTNSDVKMALSVAVTLYQANFADAVSNGIAKNEVALKLLKGFNNGVKQALSNASPSLRYRSVRR